MKKIQVERIYQKKVSPSKSVNDAGFILFIEKVEDVFREQIEKRALGQNGGDDEFEVITEWL